MKFRNLLFSLAILTFFFTSLFVFSGDKLSYTEDQTWFRQKRGTSEVTQSHQRQPWRQATWKERVDYFISQLRSGDRRAFLYVEYSLLGGYATARGYPTIVGGKNSGGVLSHLHQQAKKSNSSVGKVLTKGDAKIRKKVVRATLSGLFNKDPRVRLVATNLLRRLRPDRFMARDVKKALLLETVTTERSKWREKDIDIPSIENPRLGWGASAWTTGAGAPIPLNDRFEDGVYNRRFGGLLQGERKGQYLSEGLYNRSQRNDFETEITDADHSVANSFQRYNVWTKASLLRYGADEQVSGKETHYGYKRNAEVMPRYTYAYLDYRDPVTERIGDSLYVAYHSVWEEMKKLDLFISRAVWVARVKSGKMDSLKIISKDTFRALADQIDGESMVHVPFKTYGIFTEPHVRQIIVGLLENRVVSTREECARWLIAVFEGNLSGRAQSSAISTATKREIKKALREARRRELLIDTIRGRHLHAELVVPAQPDDWWGERDEVDTSNWAGNRRKFLELYKNQVEFPEETDIIYHDRRKPGQSDDDDDDDDDAAGGDDDDDAVSGGGDDDDDAASGGGDEETSKEYAPIIGHPLLTKTKLSFEDLERYLQLNKFFTSSKKSVSKSSEPKADEPVIKEPVAADDDDDDDDDASDDDDDDDDDDVPGQSPGVRTTKEAKYPDDPEKRSYMEGYYTRIRAVEALFSLLLARGDDLLKIPYLDFQNAILILESKIQGTGRAAAANKPSFISYLLAGAFVSKDLERGRRYHGHKDLALELDRGNRARANLNELWNKITKDVGQYTLDRKPMNKTLDELKKIREEYQKVTPEHENERPVPGRSADKGLGSIGRESKRGLSQERHGKYYGTGRGGYYSTYDQQYILPQASDDAQKLRTNFYQFQPRMVALRRKMVKGLLVALGDKDPQKRLLIIHLLRRLIPDASMLPTVNKHLRELETDDKRPWRYFDTIKDYTDPANPLIRRQEKIVGHELLKLQRFIIRRILVNKIRSGADISFLKEIPKGSFLTLVVRIDAEWDPFRIPLRTPIPRNANGDNGMFFTKDTIGVLSAGLENRNFLVQREITRWIITFYNYNRTTGHLGDPGSDSDAKKFIQAMKFAERRDIVYYERNYVLWKYKNYAAGGARAVTEPLPDTEYRRVQKGANVIGVPVGRIGISLGTPADSDIFYKIDLDRQKEFMAHYGRAKDSDMRTFSDADKDIEGIGATRQAYRRLREEREARKAKLWTAAP